MGQREILSLKASMKNKAVSVYRLDADSVLKKEVEPGQKDALSSAGYGLGRGVKRKLSNGEESALEIPYPQQRQLVMDLCVNKLQSCQRGAEPSLHRSVLLANTLRQIQQEMRLEGEDAWLLTSSAPFPPPTPRHVPELLPVPMSTSSSSSSSLGEDVKDCVESRPPSPEETVTKTPDSLFGTFEITNSTSYLTDLQIDDIFEDIDTSMYDSSEISVLTFSAPREDGLKNLSNLQLCLADLSDLDHIMDILLWLSNILLFFLLAVMRQNPDPTPVYIIVPNSTCML